MFQIAVIALLLVSVLSAAALAGTAPASWRLIRLWNPENGSRVQITLERGSYLLSTLIRLVALIQIVSLLLFVQNADRMAEQFVGAMCAVGVLSVNIWGFPSLLLQIVVFFSAVLWLLVDRADSLARNYPAIRFKHALALFLLLPLTVVNLAVQMQYFVGLHPDVITSCCGSLFSDQSAGVAGEMVSLPLDKALALFHGAVLVAVVANLGYALRGRFGGLSGLTSVCAFAGGIIGVVSFVSLYVYEHPNHHCPFCLLQAEHGYIGYALYLPLFLATAAGMGVGVLSFLRGRRGLETVLPRLSVQLAWIAAGGFTLFLVIADAAVLTSHLTLTGA